MNTLSRGITRLEVIVVIVACALLTMAFVLLSRSNSMALANRAVCSANIRGIVQSMFIYAQSNNGQFPCTPGPDGSTYSNAPQKPMDFPAISTAKRATAAWFGGGAMPQESDLGDPLACMWLLVLEGQDTPKSYICPSDPIATTPAQEYRTAGTAKNPYYQANFGVMAKGGELNIRGKGESYSVAYPWLEASGGQIAQPGPWWTDHDSSDVPVVSDMAPADIAAFGAADRNTVQVPADNPYSNYIYNSTNHDGKGQNVGFGDDHVSWVTNPYCGIHHDNIFTYYSRPYTGNGEVAAAPQVGLKTLGTAAPAPALSVTQSWDDTDYYDICMVPVRNGSPYGVKRRW